MLCIVPGNVKSNPTKEVICYDEAMKEAAAFLSALLILIAAPPYVIDTIKGKTKPERITWFIFSILGVIAFVSQVAAGASWSLVFSGLDTSASILVFLLALKHGVGGHTRLDVWALCVAGIGVVIAIVAKEPLISLLGVILADVSGFALTVKKTYENPSSETTISLLLVGTAALFGIAAADKLSLSILLYPFYLMLANYVVPFTQFLGYRMRPKKTGSTTAH
jgi:hypothetical protein